MGKHLDYKQETNNNAYAQAKAECEFSDRLYDILLAYQKGLALKGKPSESVPLGNVGELNHAMSRVYNLIWIAALGLNKKDSPTKQKQKQMEVIA